MNITYQEFIEVVPSATQPDEELFNALHAEIENKFHYIEDIIGQPLFGKLAELEVSLLEPAEERIEDLVKAIKRFVATAAYHDAIPQLDLVLTSTGFGVVSNQNVAPASAERVERLLQSLHVQSLKYFDHVLDLARYESDFIDSKGYRLYLNSFFWHYRQARMDLGIPEATRDNLNEMRPAINEAEAAVRTLISPEFFNELLNAERTAGATILQRTAIDLVRKVLASVVTKSPMAKTMTRTLLSFLDDRIEMFPTYANSTAYQANHFKPYENAKEDSCFFFGA